MATNTECTINTRRYWVFRSLQFAMAGSTPVVASPRLVLRIRPSAHEDTTQALRDVALHHFQILLEDLRRDGRHGAFQEGRFFLPQPLHSAQNASRDVPAPHMHLLLAIKRQHVRLGCFDHFMLELVVSWARLNTSRHPDMSARRGSRKCRKGRRPDHNYASTLSYVQLCAVRSMSYASSALMQF